MLREKLTNTASKPFRDQHKSLYLVKTLRRFDFLLPGLSRQAQVAARIRRTAIMFTSLPLWQRVA
ncbi:hypothetical protein P692DRAFT_20837355 [Suillus brevipes Sb2]|nr:hypothetical protein P692DRAFT_20837355 [Suillus brevipes Sb2]